MSINQSNENELRSELEERSTARQNSYFGALMHLLKSIIGIGILSLPYAFKSSGLVFGIFGTIFIVSLCAHTGYMLVDASQKIRKSSKTGLLGFSDTCALILENGPKRIQRFSTVLKYAINAVICIGSILGNSASLIFISQSLEKIFTHWFPHNVLRIEIYILIISGFFLILVQVRELVHLVPFSLFANTCMFLALILSLYYMFEEMNNPACLPAFTSLKQLPQFFGSVFFAANAIVLYLPVENTMKNPQKFLGATGVLIVSKSTVGFIYIIFGLFGFLRYGEKTMPSITLNLPIDKVPTQIVQIMLLLSIMFTYVLIVYLPMEIIWTNYLQYIIHGCIKRNLVQILMRCFIVLLTAIVSIALPKFEIVISLLGSIVSSTLVLLIPITLDTAIRWNNELGCYKWRLFKNILIGIFYIFILLTSISQNFN